MAHCKGQQYNLNVDYAQKMSNFRPADEQLRTINALLSGAVVIARYGKYCHLSLTAGRTSRLRACRAASPLPRYPGPILDKKAPGFDCLIAAANHWWSLPCGALPSFSPQHWHG
jgi:hypothetical protein